MIRAAVLLLALLLAAGGCRSLTGRSAGQWLDDTAITARVKARLAAERAVNLTRIHVDTYESTVYLTGGVPSAEAKQRAEEIARSVPQVALVVNNLHVVGAAEAASPPSESGALPVVLARAGPLARLELDQGPPGWTRYVGLDASGRRVATVFMVPASVLTERGIAGLTAEAPVEHVGVYPDGPRAYVVLWHPPGAVAAARLESRAADVARPAASPPTTGSGEPDGVGGQRTPGEDARLPADVRGRVEHHVREANRLAASFEAVLAGGCPRTGPAEWQAFLDGEVERLGRLVAHVEEAWAEARTSPDDEIRRLAKAPRRRLREAHALATKLEACARANGTAFDALAVWRQVQQEIPRRRAEIALPR
ncbi:MAG TPA: BON domain-containing protein [Candidatus Binatia bacterium]|nr:BON domain-containing protein [Candidatus Binatia bacterium]